MLKLKKKIVLWLLKSIVDSSRGSIDANFAERLLEAIARSNGNKFRSFKMDF